MCSGRPVDRHGRNAPSNVTNTWSATGSVSISVPCPSASRSIANRVVRHAVIAATIWSAVPALSSKTRTNSMTRPAGSVDRATAVATASRWARSAAS